jgi:uncharacterized protein (TIGR03000 family)
VSGGEDRTKILLKKRRTSVNRLPRLLPAALACLVLTGLALAQQGPGYATLVVSVPESATLKIGDYVATQKGAVRTLYTSNLEPGYTYCYVLEATWTEAGKDKKTTRKVTLQANKTVEVNLAEATQGEPKKEEPKKEPKKEEPKKVEPKKEAKKVEPKKELPKKVDTRVLGKSRSFLFTYAGAVKDLEPGQEANVWLPVPSNTLEQTVDIVSKKLPANGSFYNEKQYGNKALFFTAKADKEGKVPFDVVFRVTRQEVKTDVRANVTLEPRSTDDVSRFLEPDKLVPIGGKPLDLIKDKKLSPNDKFAAAKVLYDVVNNHMKYSKEGKGWGRGDAVWACDSKFGNCTDFHSLFISMARGNQIPSKFEMGFSMPAKRGAGSVSGYHCWAWFMPNGKGWIPVDISEANRFPEMKEYYFGSLTEDRVQFTTGRDIDLEPRQKGPALNFFIYPYVEVNGQAYAQDKITRAFSYLDVPGK